jgi:Tol biopolymer transport system component
VFQLTSRLCGLTAAAVLAGLVACGDGTGPGGGFGVGQIAFTSARDGHWDIYVVEPDGRGLVNLTQTTTEDLYPAWSPDRTLIAFVSGQFPAGVYLMNADGSDKRLIHSVLAVERLSWSPDGSRIAFQASSGSGWDIFLMNADGSNVFNLSQAAGFANSSDANPSWSPDGRTIAFHSEREGWADIWTVNVDGSGARNLTHGMGGPNGFEGDAAWSPDGSRIAFVSDAAADGSVGGSSTGVWVMDASGANRRRLTGEFGTVDRLPDWSPNGSWLVFQRDELPIATVHVIRANGTGLQPLASAGEPSGHPSW